MWTYENHAKKTEWKSSDVCFVSFYQQTEQRQSNFSKVTQWFMKLVLLTHQWLIALQHVLEPGVIQLALPRRHFASHYGVLLWRQVFENLSISPGRDSCEGTATTQTSLVWQFVGDKSERAPKTTQNELQMSPQPHTRQSMTRSTKLQPWIQKERQSKQLQDILSTSMLRQNPE